MQGIGIIRACLTVIKFTIGVIKTLIGYIKKVIIYIYIFNTDKSRDEVQLILCQVRIRYTTFAQVCRDKAEFLNYLELSDLI